MDEMSCLSLFLSLLGLVIIGDKPVSWTPDIMLLKSDSLSPPIFTYPTYWVDIVLELTAGARV